MKIITGLGNPGPQYAETRHNIGFLVVDMLAEMFKLEFRPKFQGLWADGNIEGVRVMLLKPMTYMNLSGRSLRELVSFYKIQEEDILIAYDDMDLPLGKIRFRNRGSAGGHNGMKSVLRELETDNFWRLKIGVGRPSAEWDPAGYVLAPFTAEEEPTLEEVLERVEKAVLLWLKGEVVQAMNVYNR